MAAGPAVVRSADAPLLTDEGDLSPELTAVLEHVFTRFAGPAQGREASVSPASKDDDDAVQATKSESSATAPEAALSDAQLDDFARVVNGGKVMSDAEKAELREFFDVDSEGRLTLAGFCEMYHMQTSSDEDETWKDLKALGYDRQLKRDT